MGAECGVALKLRCDDADHAAATGGRSELVEITRPTVEECFNVMEERGWRITRWHGSTKVVQALCPSCKAKVSNQRPPRMKEEKLILWLHLLSHHKIPLEPKTSLDGMVAAHVAAHDHAVLHDPWDRSSDLAAAGKCLVEFVGSRGNAA